MDRTLAVEIARKCAKAKPQSYYAEPFEPHEWVVDAVMEAALLPPPDLLAAFADLFEWCNDTLPYFGQARTGSRERVIYERAAEAICRHTGADQSLVGNEFDRATQYREQKEAERLKARLEYERLGWVCPSCGATNGPLVGQCPCRGNKTLGERVRSL